MNQSGYVSHASVKCIVGFSIFNENFKWNFFNFKEELHNWFISFLHFCISSYVGNFFLCFIIKLKLEYAQLLWTNSYFIIFLFGRLNFSNFSNFCTMHNFMPFSRYFRALLRFVLRLYLIILNKSKYFLPYKTLQL